MRLLNSLHELLTKHVRILLRTESRNQLPRAISTDDDDDDDSSEGDGDGDEHRRRRRRLVRARDEKESGQLGSLNPT